jgi:hypothetical protein
LTYSGQGLNKRGVHAEHHAIIYSGKKPVAFRGEKEKGLQKRSIKVTPDNPRHKLDDASRLNYAKTYTVEYNVKVVSLQRWSFSLAQPIIAVLKDHVIHTFPFRNYLHTELTVPNI